MPDFVIRISTPSDLSGAQATKVAFDALGVAVERVAAEEHAAGNATDQLQGKFERLRNAQGQFQSVGAGAASATKSIGELSKETDSFLSKIQLGVGIHFGEKIIEGVEEIGHAFVETVHKGIEYNAQMETLSIGLAATFRSVEPEKYFNFDQAKKAGVETLETLRDRANALGIDFHSLAESYGANLNALIEGGATQPAQQIELVSTLIQAATSKGVNGARALTDSIDILNGRVGNIVLAKELGLTEAALKKAAESGQTYSYIMSKLPGYQEAAADRANSYQGTLNVLHNQLEKLEGDLAKPTFDKLMLLLQGGKGALGGTEASGMAQGLGNALGGMLDGVENYAKSIESFWDRHPWLKKANEAVNSVLPENILFKPIKDNVNAGIATAEVQAQDKQFKGLEEKIGNAKDDKAVAEARKELEEAIAAATEREAKARGDAKENAKQYLDVLKVLRDPSYFGAAKEDTSAADAKARKDAAALADYNASPRAKSAAGGLESEQAAHDAEAHEKLVVSITKEIEKEHPMSEAQARKLAEQEATKREILKLDKALNTELEGIVAKEDRIASSVELGAKLKGVYGGIIGKLPDTARAGLTDQPSNTNLAAVTSAVESISVPEGDKAALDAKKQLVDQLKEAVRLQHEYDQAVSKEDGSRDKEAAEAKQRNDALADEKEEIAISQARAKGEKDVADQLEKQRDIRKETTRLQQEGVGYAEAHALAEEKIAAQNAEQDRKDADRAAKHHGKGGDGPVTTYGYSDPIHDGPNELHTGHTQTYTTDGMPSEDRFAGVPDAVGDALKGPTGAAKEIAKASSYVPSFADPASQSLTPYSGLFDIVGAQTAGAWLQPAIPSSVGASASPAGGTNGATAVSPADGGANSALAELKSAASAAATELRKVKAPSGSGPGSGSGSPFADTDAAADKSILDMLLENG